MKKQNPLRRIAPFFLCLLFLATLLPAQAVGEECNGGACDARLYCVDVTMPGGQRKKLCSECTQSQLNSYTSKVKTECKWFGEGEGWYPNKNPIYLDARAADGRVPVEIFDDLLEKTKDCREAREDRDNACWDGGDPGHRTAREDIRKMTTNIGKVKNDDIRNKKVFYCSKSTYESALRNYNSKCGRFDASRMEDKLEDMEDDVSDKKKIDCDDLEDYQEECEECYKAAYDFYRNAFDGSSSKCPDDVYEKMEDAEALQELAEEILDDADDDDLCD